MPPYYEQALARLTAWSRPFIPCGRRRHRRFLTLQNLNHSDPSLRAALLRSEAPVDYPALRRFSHQVRALLEAPDPFRCYRGGALPPIRAVGTDATPAPYPHRDSPARCVLREGGQTYHGARHRDPGAHSGYTTGGVHIGTAVCLQIPGPGEKTHNAQGAKGRVARSRTRSAQDRPRCADAPLAADIVVRINAVGAARRVHTERRPVRPGGDGTLLP